MGNEQVKSPGSGGPGTPGSRRKARPGGGSSPAEGKKRPVVSNGTQQDQEEQSPGAAASAVPAVDTSYLDAPAGALPPHLARLKNEGNHLFKHGQFGDALEKYTQAIDGCADAGVQSPEDVSILYSNRAACLLKDGNSIGCIEDCNKALELQPFSVKPLLRRAMAHESLERYKKAYVDHKTVLQIESVQSSHDSVNRITKMLIDQDGPNWREKLPEIPVVPLSVQQKHRDKPVSTQLLQARADRAANEEARRKETRFSTLKKEGNELVRQGQYQQALEKYSECLTLKPDECVLYTNRAGETPEQTPGIDTKACPPAPGRAICFLKLNRCQEAKQDCDSAIQMEPTNKKAFYRRALAHKGLKDYLSASSDLQEVLQLDPNVHEAEKELEEVMVLLRQSLVDGTTRS